MSFSFGHLWIGYRRQAPSRGVWLLVSRFTIRASGEYKNADYQLTRRLPLTQVSLRRTQTLRSAKTSIYHRRLLSFPPLYLPTVKFGMRIPVWLYAFLVIRRRISMKDDLMCVSRISMPCKVLSDCTEPCSRH